MEPKIHESNNMTQLTFPKRSLLVGFVNDVLVPNLEGEDIFNAVGYPAYPEDPSKTKCWIIFYTADFKKHIQPLL